MSVKKSMAFEYKRSIRDLALGKWQRLAGSGDVCPCWLAVHPIDMPVDAAKAVFVNFIAAHHIHFVKAIFDCPLDDLCQKYPARGKAEKIGVERRVVHQQALAIDKAQKGSCLLAVHGQK